MGQDGLVLDGAAQTPYLNDWLGKWHGRAAVVVRPRDTEQTAAVMRICHQTHTPVVTQGGNTGMSGGATPDCSGAQVILSTARMRTVRHVDPINNTITVDAGCVLQAVQDERCTGLHGVPTMFIAELDHPRFADFDGRVAHRRELDAVVAALGAAFRASCTVSLLTADGVHAAAPAKE